MNVPARRFLRGSAAGAILLLMLIAARVAVASGSAAPTGDKRGVALLARVEKAYRSVQGVRIRLGSINALLVLRAGFVVAEEATLGSKIYVSRDGRTTYVDVPSKSCWLRSQGIILDIPGTQFPLSYRTTGVQVPHRVAGGWTVKMTAESATRVRTIVVLRINTPSYFVRSAQVFENGMQLSEQVTELSIQPNVPTPRPLC